MTISNESQSEADPHHHSSWRRGFASTADADRFWDLLIKFVPKLVGPVESIDRDSGAFTLVSGGTIMVHNPAVDIRNVNHDQWPDFVKWWLGNLAKQTPGHIEATTRRWSQVKGALRVRLLPPYFLENQVAQALSAELSWGLAVKIPGGSCPATIEMVERWQIPRKVLWSTAKRNTRKRVKAKRTDVIAAQRHLRLFEGGLFTTGLLGDLTKVMPEIGADGALAVAPSSHSLLVQPIDGWGPDVGEDAARLLCAGLMYQEDASHLLPPVLLWYRGPGDLVAAAEFDHGMGEGFAMNILAPEPLRGYLDWPGFDALANDLGPAA